MASLESRKTEYISHESAGIDFCNTFRAQLSLDIESGARSLGECLEIQKVLRGVGDELRNGDWKSGLHLISMIRPNGHCPKSIINDMTADINAYITSNYSW